MSVLPGHCYCSQMGNKVQPESAGTTPATWKDACQRALAVPNAQPLLLADGAVLPTAVLQAVFTVLIICAELPIRAAQLQMQGHTSCSWHRLDRPVDAALAA